MQPAPFSRFSAFGHARATHLASGRATRPTGILPFGLLLVLQLGAIVRLAGADAWDTSVWPNPRFSDRGDGTFVDNLTALMWSRDANPWGTNTWYTCVDLCENYTLAGHDDWRLPNALEYASLMAPQYRDPALCDTAGTSHWAPGGVITNVPDASYSSLWYWYPYWTSSWDVYELTGVPTPLVIYLHTSGGLNIQWQFPEKDPGYAWPVRGPVSKHFLQPVPRTGQNGDAPVFRPYPGSDGSLLKGAAWPNPRFKDNGDGTVADNLSGLMWTKNANLSGRMRWSAAVDYAEQCSVGGYEDWRMPSVKELLSLIDWRWRDIDSPSIPNTSGLWQWSEGDPFDNVINDPGLNNAYWTRTRVGGSGNHVWFMTTMGRMHALDASMQTLSHNFPAWPVRGEWRLTKKPGGAIMVIR